MALDRWPYRRPVGLVFSNRGACAPFEALTGASPACCAAIGKMCIPEMRSRGDPDDVATGSICAGGSLGLIYATGRRIYGAAAGFWAATFGLLSPFLRFMSGSYMSHTATMLCVAAALYCFQRPSVSNTSVWPLATGFSPRWALISRPAAAACITSLAWSATGCSMLW